MLKARWGRIVNVSSISAVRANSGQANYAASKAGLLGFTRVIATEMGKRNITSNAVTPGFIETDMTAELPAKELATPSRRPASAGPRRSPPRWLPRAATRRPTSTGRPWPSTAAWAPERHPNRPQHQENTTMASQQEILEAIRAELTAIKVPDAETAQPDTTWEQLDVDSLDLVELVKALEDRFDVQIADPDLKGIASVGDAITLVERLQGGRPGRRWPDRRHRTGGRLAGRPRRRCVLRRSARPRGRGQRRGRRAVRGVRPREVDDAEGGAPDRPLRAAGRRRRRQAPTRPA